MGTVVKLTPLNEVDDLFADMIAAAAVSMPVVAATLFIIDKHQFLDSDIKQDHWVNLVIRKMNRFDPERYMHQQIDFAGVARQVVNLLKERMRREGHNSTVCQDPRRAEGLEGDGSKPG